MPDTDLIRDAVDELDDLFYVFSPDGEFMEWNDAFREVTGYDDEQIDAMHPTELFSGDDQDAVERAIERIVEDGTRYTVEANLVTAEGDELPYELSGSPLSDDGEVTAIAGVGRDISKQQETEEKLWELTQSAELLRDAVDELDDLFYIFSPDGKFREWNDALLEVTGYEDEQIDAMHPTKLFSGDDQEAIEKIIERITADGQRYTVEANLITADGQEVPYEFSGSPLTQEGEVNAIVGVARDISAQQETEEKLRELTREIQDLSMPVIEIWDGVTLATVVGSLDTHQAENLTEDLLEEITEKESSAAIIDITGVTTIDTATAQHLIDTINAVNLLGADVIITGIKPSIAQTLVQLGVPLSDIETRASLMEGLRTALGWQGVTMDR